MPKGLEIVGCDVGVVMLEKLVLLPEPLSAEGGAGVDIGEPNLLPEVSEEVNAVNSGTVMDEEARICIGLIVDEAGKNGSPFVCVLARSTMDGTSFTTRFNCESVASVDSKGSVEP